jgi:hypothetical protein
VQIGTGSSRRRIPSGCSPIAATSASWSANPSSA